MIYFVKVKEIHYSTYEIESESKEEAIASISDFIETGDNEKVIFHGVDYSHTCDKDEWAVN